MYIRIELCVVVLLCCAWRGVRAAEPDEFQLTILHLNDFHARFEETNVYSGRCTVRDRERNGCFGGFARLQTALKRELAKNPDALFLAAGDYFQGTIWYTVHKWKALAHVLNLIHHDAMSFGNHEFDDGVAGVVPFLEAVNFPVLGANLQDAREPSIQGKYRRSLVITRGGRKIGIIGYVTTETLVISNPGRLGITDEEEALRQEARRLRQEEGVSIIVALGHAGFRRDTKIATNVEEVDVVVGGHTNTFLYTGQDPSTEPKVGEYPTVVTQASGRKVPVVQAYAFGKYLGKLTLTFDAQGEVMGWEGNPILLDMSIEEDPDILEAMRPFKEEIVEVMSQEIGRTYVFLDGQRLSCRLKECNLGNIETDAIIHQNAKYPDDLRWAHTSLAVLNGGGIRASIDERSSNGSLTMEDVLTVAPFQNTIDIVELHGRYVKEMFEHSVARYDPQGLDPPGGFLQVSGFVVVYDVNLASGSRVVRLQARCQECRVPELVDVADDQVYRIAMPSFLAMGGDGYATIRDHKVNHHLTGMLDTDVYMQYIQQATPLYQGLENRILFIDTSELCPAMREQLTRSGHPAHRVETAPHNPWGITPHQMVQETMQRHNDYYYRTYYTSSANSSVAQKTKSHRKQEEADGTQTQDAVKKTGNGEKTEINRKQEDEADGTQTQASLKKTENEEKTEANRKQEDESDGTQIQASSKKTENEEKTEVNRKQEDESDGTQTQAPIMTENEEKTETNRKQEDEHDGPLTQASIMTENEEKTETNRKQEDESDGPLTQAPIMTENEEKTEANRKQETESDGTQRQASIQKTEANRKQEDESGGTQTQPSLKKTENEEKTEANRKREDESGGTQTQPSLKKTENEEKTEANRKQEDESGGTQTQPSLEKTENDEKTGANRKREDQSDGTAIESSVQKTEEIYEEQLIQPPVEKKGKSSLHL